MTIGLAVTISCNVDMITDGVRQTNKQTNKQTNRGEAKQSLTGDQRRDVMNDSSVRESDVLMMCQFKHLPLKPVVSAVAASVTERRGCWLADIIYTVYIFIHENGEL